jgi:hypothetical protein
MSKAGDFEITVADPYPVWCNLRYRGETVARFTHEELSDLKYAVEKAMRKASKQLGSEKEVYLKTE